jgi:hypothetical protein
MAFPRGHHNLTLLPDGTVLVTGGGRTTDGTNLAEAVYEAELWSPVTETWTTMAPMQIPRLYHSTALLLPDGRILSAGGGRFNPIEIDQPSAEIYSPPYLFRGPRPTIAAAPTTVQYGTTFFVGTPDATSIARVTLVRPGAVTHSVNMDQRFLNLTFQQAAGGLEVQAPANPTLAPPGYYMLFLVNTGGVPAVATFVSLPLSSGSEPPTITSIDPTSAPAGGAGFTLMVNGTNFVANSVVRWNGADRATTFGSATQLTATILASDIVTAGTAQVTVFNPAPGGGTSNPQTFTISNPPPDTTAPTVSVTPLASPVSGTVTVGASASDNVGVNEVRLLVDGTLIGTDTIEPYAVAWNTTTVADGVHTLTAAASDAAGNVGVSAPVAVTVENAAPPPPELSLSLSAPDSIGRGGEFTVTATVANTGASTSGLSATIDWSPSDRVRLRGSSQTQAVPTVPAGGNASVSWNMRAINEGTATLTVTVTDSSGTVNLQESRPLTIEK